MKALSFTTLGRTLRRAGVAMFSVLLLVGEPAMAIETIPTAPPLEKNPFQIVAYSFRGDHLRYVQLYNASSDVQSLNGWTLTTRGTAGEWRLDGLSGLMRPASHVVIADGESVTGVQLQYQHDGTSPEPLVEITIHKTGVAPETISIDLKSSTPRDAATNPPTYYATRSVSSSSGNYLSSWSYASSPPATLMDDALYEYAATTGLRISEVFPSAAQCSPLVESANCREYVELYNGSNQAIDIGEYRLAAGDSAGDTKRLLPRGLLEPGAYFAIQMPVADSGNYLWLENSFGLHRYDETVVQYPSNAGRGIEAWAVNSASGSWQWTPMITPGAENIFPGQGAVNACDGLRLSEIGANLGRQFIEVRNALQSSISLDGCQLQTNRSSIKSYQFGDERLAAGDIRAVFIDQTELTLTKTTSGTVYLLSSDGETEVDSVDYDDLAADSSLALVDGVWRQSFEPTPGEENIRQDAVPCQSGYERNTLTGRCNKIAEAARLTPCAADQYRSPETNRCRKKTTLTSTLASCAADQYRNPVTNRCRKLASSSTSTLKPCAPHQIRNPATNRCKSTSSATSSLKPCQPGYERNPATNRCRKSAGSVLASTAPYAVEPLQESGKALVSWWALGGVMMAGLGVVGWQWRNEIRQWVGRLAERAGRS